MKASMIEHVRTQPNTHWVTTLIEKEGDASVLEVYAQVGAREWQLLQPTLAECRASLIPLQAIYVLVVTMMVPTYLDRRFLSFTVNYHSIAGKTETACLAAQATLKWHIISEVGYHGTIERSNPAREGADLLQRVAPTIPVWTPVEIETARAELRQRFPDTESIWRGLRERNTAIMSANAFTAPFGSGPGWG